MNSVVRTATSLASEAGRFSQMLTTQIVEKTKEVGIPAHLYETAEEKTADILPGLNSKFDKEKLDAMKRLVALMSKGNNVSEFFPHVIKNVASQSFDVRKLVYIYLLRYAEQEPDLALLSINTFQKDMTDKNPLIRAMALRVMSSIRVPVIAPIITLALRKGVSDLSPYVRKAAANAIPKCFSLDPMQKDCLIELLVLLLNDKSTVVLGTAVSSLNRICPDRYDLIHKHYHKLCRLMIDCDEWGQIEIMTMIMRYVRVNFLPPITEASTALSESPAFKSSYRDNDHAQFISSIKPLLHSRNISVVLTVITAISTTGSMADLNKAVPFLIRLVRYSRENQYAVLLVILSICKTIPGAFSEFCHCFAVFHGDIPVIRDLKLEIMECIVCKENMEFVLGEFKAYVTNADEKLCIRTIQVWGRLASRLPFVIDQSLKTLVALVSEPNAAIVGEVIIVLRRLLQARSDLDAHNAAETSLLLTVDTKQSGDKSTTTTKVIRQLFQSYDSITVSMAKASVLWLIGHYVTSLPLIAPDALRVAVKSFVTEGEVVKLQTLNLAASVAVNLETCKIHMEMGKAVDTSMQVSCDSRVLNVVRLCFEYVLELARYDLNFDVRDRARFLAALVHRPLYLYDDKDHEKDDLETRYATLCRLVQILAGSQGVSKPADPFDALAAFRTGTLSHAVGTRVDGYTDLPPWTTVPSNASLRVVVETNEEWHRDRVVTSTVKHIRTTQSKKIKRVVALDDFLASDNPLEVDILSGISGRGSLSGSAREGSSATNSRCGDDATVADQIPKGPPANLEILNAVSALQALDDTSSDEESATSEETESDSDSNESNESNESDESDESNHITMHTTSSNIPAEPKSRNPIHVLEFKTIVMYGSCQNHALLKLIQSVLLNRVEVKL